MELVIPDPIVQSLRLPEPEQQDRLLLELALALYAQRLLSFGKSRNLVHMGPYEFGHLLLSRGITRHYTWEEYEDDVAYACGE
jgi:predicted HTH domain antitoxin